MSDKDAWDKAHVIFGAIGVVLGAILLPVAIFIGSWLIAEAERDSSEEIAATEHERTVAFSKTANLTNLIQYLGSSNEQEKIIGLEVAQHLSETDQLPIEITRTIIRIAEDAKTASTAIAASSTVDAIAKNDQNLSDEIEAQLSTIPPRVYFQISDESLRGPAREISSKLEEAEIDQNLVVPGIELVDEVKFSSSLRYFDVTERAEAERILQRLNDLGVEANLIDLSERYGNSTSIRPRHYELWLSDDL